jgi:hypothetical protein
MQKSHLLNKNMNATCNNFKYFTELQIIKGNQSFEIHSLGPNLWISIDWEYRYAYVGHRYLTFFLEKQSVSGVSTICLMQL